MTKGFVTKTLIGRPCSKNRIQIIEVVLNDNDISCELRRYPGEKQWRLVLLDASDLDKAHMKEQQKVIELSQGTLSKMIVLALEKASIRKTA